jgi:hypothetical protein
MCFINIFYPLSLNVKLHDCKTLFWVCQLQSLGYGLNYLLKQKNENYYKFVNMNAMAFQNLLLLTLKNY